MTGKSSDYLAFILSVTSKIAIAMRLSTARPYEFVEWRKAPMGPNIHIEIDGHYYSSVPHALAGVRPSPAPLSPVVLHVPGVRKFYT